MKQLSLLCLFLIAAPAWGLDLKTSVSETNSYLSVSLDATQFTLDEGTITGNGIKLDFTHYLNSSTNIEIFLSSALNGQGSSSFTTVGGYFYYSLWGDCCKLNKNLTMDGTPVLSESSSQKNSFLVGIGMDQVFLNGSKSVYSISGLGVGAEYYFRLFDYTFKAAGRYSMMNSGGVNIQGMFFSLGLSFGL